MREKGGQRRFRPGWMQNESEEGGIDNPAMDPAIAHFSVGDPEDADAPDVAITVTDADKHHSSVV